MAGAELFSTVGTLGEMASRVQRWAREAVDPDMVNDAINDAIESLWQSACLATLSRFISGPTPQSLNANSTSFTVVSIADPTSALSTAATPGGMLPDRQYTVGFTYTTDSGTETKMCPALVVAVPAAQLLVIIAPDAIQQAYGWNLYAGPAGQQTRQNVQPLPWNQMWIEPPFGIQNPPNSDPPPAFNTTADNIASISRLDVSNQDGTLSGRRQSNLSSTMFTQMQARLPITTSYALQAYDLIDNRIVELRPAANYTMDATIYYITRPRRLRFANSKIPFHTFASSRFIGCMALSDVLLSLYEDESADRWEKKAEQERERIQLAIVAENWDKNNTVRPHRA